MRGAATDLHAADADGAPNAFALAEVQPRNLKGILNTENPSNDQFFTYSAQALFNTVVLLLLIQDNRNRYGSHPRLGTALVWL